MRKKSESSIKDCRGDRCQREQMTWADDVGEIKERAQESPRDKAQLHREREPARRACAEIPFPAQRRHYRRAAEPKRHAQQLSYRQQRKRAPP